MSAGKDVWVTWAAEREHLPKTRLGLIAYTVALIVSFAVVCALLYWVGSLASRMLDLGLWLKFGAVCVAIAVAIWCAYRSMAGRSRWVVCAVLILAFAAPFLRRLLSGA